MHACSSALNADETAEVLASEGEPTLLALVEGWLERTPAVDDESLDVWGKLKANLQQAQVEVRYMCMELSAQGDGLGLAAKYTVQCEAHWRW